MRILFHAKGAEISAKGAEDYSRMGTDCSHRFCTDTFQSADFSFEIELPLARMVCAVGVGIVLLIERKLFPKFRTLEKVILPTTDRVEKDIKNAG
jgi:hypothetical protein